MVTRDKGPGATSQSTQTTSQNGGRMVSSPSPTLSSPSPTTTTSTNSNISSSSSGNNNNSHHRNHNNNNNNSHQLHESGKKRRSLTPSSATMTPESLTTSCNRLSLRQLSSEKKAKRLKFFRNGDKFFKGAVFALLPHRVRTMDALILELNRLLKDLVSLRNGVRVIFTLDGKSKITSIDQLEAGCSYVAASSDQFHSFDYESIAGLTSFSTSSKLLSSSSNVPNLNLYGVSPTVNTSGSINQSPCTTNSGSKKVTSTPNNNPIKSKYLLPKRNLKNIQLPSNRKRVIPATATSSPVIATTKVTHTTSTSSIPIPKGITPSPTHPPANQTSSRIPSPRPQSGSVDNKGHDRTKDLPSCPSPPQQPSSGVDGDSFLEQQDLSAVQGSIPSDGQAPPMSMLFPQEVVAKYDIGCIIGDGNFAVVHRCTHRESRKDVALKIIDKIKCKGRETFIANEVNILKSISHDNIIQFIEVFDYINEIYLITQLVEGGDLFDSIAQANKYSEEDAIEMMRDLLSSLSYLHSLTICHRDIKPENLLVTPGTNRIKLADFGLAIHIPFGHKLFDVCGTPNYVAPEILSQTGYDHKVDVWAAGVIAFVLLCGYPPFVSPENDQDELFDHILSGNFEFVSPFWDDISHLAKQVITEMLQGEQEARITADEALKHPWLSDVEWECKDNGLMNGSQKMPYPPVLSQLNKMLPQVTGDMNPSSMIGVAGDLVSGPESESSSSTQSTCSSSFSSSGSHSVIKSLARGTNSIPTSNCNTSSFSTAVYE